MLSGFAFSRQMLARLRRANNLICVVGKCAKRISPQHKLNQAIAAGASKQTGWELDRLL